MSVYTRAEVEASLAAHCCVDGLSPSRILETCDAAADRRAYALRVAEAVRAEIATHLSLMCCGCGCALKAHSIDLAAVVEGVR